MLWMLWIYERSNQTLHIETKFDNETNEYVLIIHPLDGTQQVERFRDVASFQVRVDNLERQLHADHWQSHGMITMRDGWKL